MTLDLLAWSANEISIMMKGCIEQKPQATYDRLPDSPFKLPCIYSRNMEYNFDISESLPTFIFASLWLSTLKNIISKRTFSILISIHLLWYYKENLLQNQDMVSMVITSSTLSSDEAIQQLLYSQAKLDTLLCWSLKELCNKIYQKFKQWKLPPNWVKHKK